MHEHETDEKTGFLQKLRQNHYLMILICIVPIVLLFAGSYYFEWNSSNLLFLVFLAACIFGHMFMMGNHKGH